ncbi:hypothetical protein bpmyx0001_52120 [Bacillus pseudomycoides DSM 12442]|nr:hypothetical protein bpmyx0001_52120 [Bacillus pseudomycoides DSM 12442]
MREFYNIYEREMRDMLDMMKLILLVGVRTHLKIKEEK